MQSREAPHGCIGSRLPCEPHGKPSPALQVPSQFPGPLSVVFAAASCCPAAAGGCSRSHVTRDAVLHRYCTSVADAWTVQITAAVPGVCRVLGVEAVSLVDAFGIPDHLLAAPIAADWIKYNRVDNRGELTGSNW